MSAQLIEHFLLNLKIIVCGLCHLQRVAHLPFLKTPTVFIAIGRHSRRCPTQLSWKIFFLKRIKLVTFFKTLNFILSSSQVRNGSILK